MTNWENIHPDFTSELQEEWKGFGFVYEQVEEWIKVCGFSPQDAEFAIYIGDMGYIIDELESDELDQLRNDYNEKVEKKVNIKGSSLKRKIEEVIDPNDRSWKNIKPDFTPELVQEWQECGFSYEEIKDWINIGMKTTDAVFCAWLRDVKQVNSEQALNCGDLEQLTSEYQRFSTAIQQPGKGKY